MEEREREKKGEGATLVERASAIIAERGNARGRATMFLRADREGDIDRGLVRSGRGKDTDRKRERGREKEDVEREREEREREREEDRERIRSERDGVSQPEECLLLAVVLGPARFSRVRSVLEETIFFSAVYVRRFFFFFSGPYAALIAAPSRAFIPFYSYSLLPLSQTFLAREIYFHPPITPTPKGTRARARTNPLCRVREIATPSANTNERCIAIA